MGIFDKIFGKSSGRNKIPKSGEADVLVDQSVTKLSPLTSQEDNSQLMADVLVNQSVTRLIEIYKLIPERLSLNSIGAHEKEIKAIGVKLDKQGGMNLMLAAHDKFKANCNIYGAPRNLEVMWDGIGEWMG